MAHHALKFYALWAVTPEITVISGVAAHRSGGLQPPYYPLGYPMRCTAEGPWCYTVDAPETRWEVCDIPICKGQSIAGPKSVGYPKG
jgi:hypothetical protein